MVYLGLQPVNFGAWGAKLFIRHIKVEMPRTIDNSATARIARLRRAAASKGPIPAIRQNRGSQVVIDARLVKVECCDPCIFQWTGTSVPLAYQKTEAGYYFFTATIATAGNQVTIAAVNVGPAMNFTPCSNYEPDITTFQPINTRAGVTITFKIGNTEFVPASFKQQILIELSCNGNTSRVENTITYNTPTAYQMNISPCTITTIQTIATIPSGVTPEQHAAANALIRAANAFITGTATIESNPSSPSMAAFVLAASGAPNLYPQLEGVMSQVLSYNDSLSLMIALQSIPGKTMGTMALPIYVAIPSNNLLPEPVSSGSYFAAVNQFATTTYTYENSTDTLNVDNGVQTFLSTTLGSTVLVLGGTYTLTCGSRSYILDINYLGSSSASVTPVDATTTTLSPLSTTTTLPPLSTTTTLPPLSTTTTLPPINTTTTSTVAVSSTRPTNITAYPSFGSAVVDFDYEYQTYIYQYSIDNGVTFTDVQYPRVPLVIPNLRNGTEYTISIRAISRGYTAGGYIRGEPSAASDPVTVTPSENVPSNIGSVTIVPSYSTVSITDINDSNAFHYFIKIDNIGGSTTSISSGRVNSTSYIAQLTPNVTYSIYLAAANQYGIMNIVQYQAITGDAVPEVPIIINSFAGNKCAIITFNANQLRDSSPIITYLYSLDGITYQDSLQLSSPITINDLSNGTPYTIYLKAKSYLGISAPSSPVTVTPSSNAPVALTDISATPGDQRVTVAFTVTDGSTIFQYSKDNIYFTQFTTNPYTITGLTNYQLANIALGAVANDGSVSPLVFLPPVTPVPIVTTPDPPVITYIRPGNSSATVTFTHNNTGSVPISTYFYSIDGVNYVDSNQAFIPITITGLGNGTTYSITLKAIIVANTVYTSAPSNAVSVTPSTFVPPMLTTAVAANTGAYIYFNSEVAVTNYQYSTDGGNTFTVLSPATTTNPLYISNLANGAPVNIQVQGINGSQVSASSNTLTVTPTATVTTATPFIWYNPTGYTGTDTTLTNLANPSTYAGTFHNVAFSNSLFNFDGSTSYISVTGPTAAYATLCAWVKPSTITSQNALFSTSEKPATRIGWDISNNCYITDSTTSAPNIIASGTWQHFGLVYYAQGKQAAFYINGVPVNISETVTYPESFYNINTFDIGKYMSASLGYMKFYTNAFNATDMLAEFTSSKTQYGF